MKHPSKTLNPRAGTTRGLPKAAKNVTLAMRELEGEIADVPGDERGEAPHMFGRRIAQKMAAAYADMVESEDEELLRDNMEKILYDLGMGVPYHIAVQSAGIPLGTGGRWLREGSELRGGLKREFFLAVHQVWAQHSAFGMKTLFKGMLKGNMKLAMWYMERTHPERFGIPEDHRDDEGRARFLETVEALVREGGMAQLGLPKATIEVIEDDE